MPGRGRAGRPRRHVVARNGRNVAARYGHNREQEPEPAPEPSVEGPPAKRLRARRNTDAGNAGDADVWIIGYSIPFWAGKRAEARGKPDLDMPGGAAVSWMAVRGMGWEKATHHLQLPALFQTPPQVLVVHLGGNDLVRHSLRLVFKLINDTYDYIRAAFPDAILVWVDILPRFCWRAPKNEHKAIDKKRRRVNQLGHQAVRKAGGQVLHLDIDLTRGFFREDGVHLSDVGLDMYIDNLRELLLTIF